MTKFVCRKPQAFFRCGCLVRYPPVRSWHREWISKTVLPRRTVDLYDSRLRCERQLVHDGWVHFLHSTFSLQCGMCRSDRPSLSSRCSVRIQPCACAYPFFPLLCFLLIAIVRGQNSNCRTSGQIMASWYQPLVSNELAISWSRSLLTISSRKNPANPRFSYQSAEMIEILPNFIRLRQSRSPMETKREN